MIDFVRLYPNITSRLFRLQVLDKKTFLLFADTSQNALRLPCSTILYYNMLYAVSCIIGHEVHARPQFGKVLFNPLKLINAS